MSPGQPLPPATLEDRVWDGGSDTPRKSREALYSLISRLRAQVAIAGGELRRQDGGYLLDVQPEHVDLHRARRLVTAARVATAESDAERAAALWRQASQLWTSDPLSALPGDWADRMRQSLIHERLTTLTEWLQVELDLGRHLDVLGPLAAAHAEYPHAEPLTGLFMRALYAAGRQAEALDVYARFRARLVAEIGDEPGEDLRRLHERILRREPPVEPAPARLPTAAGPTTPMPPPGAVGSVDRAEPGGGRPGWPVPAQLPPDVPLFTGRAEQLDRLDAIVAESRSAPATVVIEGSAGVGKTSLAVHWAHRVADQFPDGQLFVELPDPTPAGPTSTDRALAWCLRALGLHASDIPGQRDEAIATYRSLTAARRLLVLLDNVVSAEQARPLLPTGGDSVAVVTSRHRLTSLMARDGASSITLDVMSPPESLALLTAVLGGDQHGLPAADIAEVAAWCGHLPLALRIAAARIAERPHHSAGAYLTRLRDRTRLAALVAPDDKDVAVRAAFEASYIRLPEPARQMFRLLGLAPGRDATADSAAALQGCPPDTSSELLETLAAGHLIAEPAPGRYRLHDLLRAYAAERAEQEEPSDARTAALTRWYDYYLDTCRRLVDRLYPHNLRLPVDPPRRAVAPVEASTAEALAWLDRERPNLIACVTGTAAAGRHRVCIDLADALRAYLQARSHLTDWMTVAGAAASAAEVTGDPIRRAAAQLSLAGLHARRDAHALAMAHARRTVALAEVAGWREASGAAYRTMASVAHHTGQAVQAVTHAKQALRQYVMSGRRPGEAAAHVTIAVALLELGRLSEAVGHARRAQRMYDALGARHSEAGARGTLGEIYRQQGRLRAAWSQLSDAGQRFRAIGDHHGVGNVQRSLAELYHLQGELTSATVLAQEALDIAQRMTYRRLEAEAMITIASLQRARDPQLALTTYQRARAVAQGSGHWYPEAEALVGFAYAQLWSGRHEQAAVTAEAARRFAGQAGYRLLEGESLTALAAAHLGGGQLEQAIADGEAAMVVHQAIGSRLAAARALLVLAQCREALGRVDSAARDRHRARSLLATAGLVPPTGQALLELSDLPWVRGLGTAG